jgi:hypothetical protein
LEIKVSTVKIKKIGMKLKKQEADKSGSDILLKSLDVLKQWFSTSVGPNPTFEILKSPCLPYICKYIKCLYQEV